MSRILKTSGFLALTIQMLWGMYNTFLVTPGGPEMTAWIRGAHAHFGILAILAIVLGFAVDHYGVDGLRRQVVTYGFVLGQWLLPATVLVALGAGLPMLSMLEYLWGVLLAISMGIMALEAWGSSTTGSTI